MNKIKILICMFVLFLGACEKDDDKLVLSGLDSSELIATATDVSLSADNSATIVLSFAWRGFEVFISDSTYGIPSGTPTITFEAASDAAFTNVVASGESTESHSYTGAELNTLAKNLALTPEVKSPVYFRLKAAYASNTTPLYSNVVIVNVTSYTIDMTIGYILDEEKSATNMILYSPDSDGEYFGFIGASGWGHWFLKEGDGKIWGNDAVSEKPFAASPADGSWNFWYPGSTGCYYTTLSTTNEEWTATYVPVLSIKGSVDETMSYARATNKWSAKFITTEDNAVLNIGCDTCQLYNKSTGTDSYGTVAIAFAPTNDSIIVLSQTAGDIVVPKAGEHTIILDLTNPRAWKYSLDEEIIVPNVISDTLYVIGATEGEGEWSFDNYLFLTSEADSTYAGVLNFNSPWGYQLAIEHGNWTDVYKLGAGNTMEGTLVFGGTDNINIPGPTNGLYFVNVDVKNLTYKLTPIGSDIYMSGINGDWVNLETLTATSVAGVYAGEVTISAISEWGIKVYLGSDWSNPFGGSMGRLKYNGDGMADDVTLANGTYTLVVDLIKNTYVFLGDLVYVNGINHSWGICVPLTKKETGVYTGTVDVIRGTPFGYNILLHEKNKAGEEDWNSKMGGTSSALEYGGDNITDTWYEILGSYVMTVNILTGTITVE